MKLRTTSHISELRPEAFQTRVQVLRDLPYDTLASASLQLLSLRQSWMTAGSSEAASDGQTGRSGHR